VDLVFILLISNAVQNAMVGNDSTLMGGVAAALGLFIVNYIFKFISYRSNAFSAALQGESMMLIYNGQMIEKNMEKAMITKEEVERAVREHGVEHCKDVNLAVLEVDGNISVISDAFATKSLHKRKGHRILRPQN
jgi:uncharacterized membrane protein YcaP (DUF421 family)